MKKLSNFLEDINESSGSEVLKLSKDMGKDRFGSVSKSWLRKVDVQLQSKGYEKEKLYWNKGGSAVWGDVIGLWWKPESEYGLYINIGGMSAELRVVPAETRP